MSELFYNVAKKSTRFVYNLLEYSNHLKIKIEGQFPKEPILLTFNHCHKFRFWFFGWKDKWADHLLAAYLPTDEIIHFAVQGKQYMKPFTRFILERLETFSTNHIRKGIKYARKGETVAVFPQGEAHRMYENKYYSGAAFIAKKGNVDITPLKIIRKEKEVTINILPKVKTSGKTLEEITQEIEKIYSD